MKSLSKFTIGKYHDLLRWISELSAIDLMQSCLRWIGTLELTEVGFGAETALFEGKIFGNENGYLFLDMSVSGPFG